MNICNDQYWIIFENNFGKLYLILNYIRISGKCLPLYDTN